MDCSLFTNMGKTDKGDRETGHRNARTIHGISAFTM